MTTQNFTWGLNTLINHWGGHNDPYGAHVLPIYQTSTFRFPDVDIGAALFKGEAQGHIYTRLSNPNHELLAQKYAALEGFDLLREASDSSPEDIVAAQIFASGMAAVTTALLAYVHPGDTVIAQRTLYAASYVFLQQFATQWGVRIVWVDDLRPEEWEKAFQAYPQARVAYAESPANPTLNLVDLQALAEIAHRFGAWLFVDNTFATPYCQRPLTLGADVVIHSTTKYLGGHGVIVGGVVVSRHVNWVRGDLHRLYTWLGPSPSPFDAWLADLGLRTFALRMERHCQNALALARYLEAHPKVARVYYPGLPSHPDYALAQKQMSAFGGMIAFELAGGLEAGKALLNNVRVMTLAVSLGSVDTLIQHPASMTHAAMSPEDRRKSGISDGLVRLSVGIEEVEDLIADFDQALARL
ncbi:MAG: trans-sulfuration enzyme family protein [Thermanaerothrix sp.]|uniref:trans-sulfuration enzyme family protein n=1 Tax=Thermanaerothrix sp. TaxID=2972675 RepID=UPI003C7C615C